MVRAQWQQLQKEWRDALHATARQRNWRAPISNKPGRVNSGSHASQLHKSLSKLCRHKIAGTPQHTLDSCHSLHLLQSLMHIPASAMKHTRSTRPHPHTQHNTTPISPPWQIQAPNSLLDRRPRFPAHTRAPPTKTAPRSLRHPHITPHPIIPVVASTHSCRHGHRHLHTPHPPHVNRSQTPPEAPINQTQALVPAHANWSARSTPGSASSRVANSLKWVGRCTSW